LVSVFGKEVPVKALFDTNVILDWWLDRKPFSFESGYLLSSAESGEISGLLCATTLTTVHYILEKALGRTPARKTLSQLMDIFDIAAVNRAVLAQAQSSKIKDFEDAVLCCAAQEAGADAIITRNEKDFQQAPLRIMTPTEVIHALENI
jgi:predicted nucleic acid-binding protein